jgi:hypothetical protein
MKIEAYEIKIYNSCDSLVSPIQPENNVGIPEPLLYPGHPLAFSLKLLQAGQASGTDMEMAEPAVALAFISPPDRLES